jgi:putative FmdB family regulatory protein
MPIFEFKCLKCNEFFEVLVMNNQNDQMEMKCPKCRSEEFERVLSTTSHTIGSGGPQKQGVSVQNRNCSSGSCTTYEIPGPTR